MNVFIDDRPKGTLHDALYDPDAFVPWVQANLSHRSTVRVTSGNHTFTWTPSMSAKQARDLAEALLSS